MVSTVFRDIYRQHPSFSRLEELLAGDSAEPVTIHGLTGSSRSIVMAGALSQQPTTHVVLLPEKEDAAYFYNDLTSLIGDDNIFFFPSRLYPAIGQRVFAPVPIQHSAFRFGVN